MPLDPKAVPSRNFDLTSWKITLPVDLSGGFSGGASEVKNLTDYSHSLYFYTGPDGAMVFNAPVGGATTSGSSYVRCELREMNGTEKAAWTLGQGGTLSATLEVDSVPLKSDGSLGRVIVGQIHGKEEELVRLYWENGSVYFMNDQAGPLNKETRFDFTNASGQRPSISLDEKFSYTIDAYGDTLQVTVRADGQIYTSTSHISAVWNTDAFYFKAGVYLGVNSGTGAGQASFYALNVSHSRTPATSTPPLTGTDGDDVIRGTAASERLDGGDGRNTVLGLGGNDLLLSGNGTDRLSGGDGADRLQSGGGRDALSGGSGRDILVGGLGQDSLTGGSGADRFRFDDRDTGAARSRADTILDFRGNLGDRIDLRRIDADTSTSRDDAFTFVGTAEFTAAGQVRYQKSSTDTWILLNTDADSSPEAVIRLKGAMDISEGWLLY